MRRIRVKGLVLGGFPSVKGGLLRSPCNEDYRLGTAPSQ